MPRHPQQITQGIAWDRAQDNAVKGIVFM